MNGGVAMKAKLRFSVLAALLVIGTASCCSPGKKGYDECSIHCVHRDYGSPIAVPEFDEYWANVLFVYKSEDTQYDYLSIAAGRQDTFERDWIDESYAVFIIPDTLVPVVDDPPVSDPASDEALQLIEGFVPLGARQNLYATRLGKGAHLRFGRGYVNSIERFEGAAIYYFGIDHDTTCVRVVQETAPWYWEDGSDHIGGSYRGPYYP
jgi:hypothetical protein